MTNNAVYYEEWRSTRTFIDDEIALVTVDLGLLRLLPMENKPDWLQVGLELNSSKDDVPDEEEIEILAEIGNFLNSILRPQLKALFAGYVAQKGMCVFNFYAEHFNDIENLVADAEKRFLSYKFRVAITENDNWDVYKNYLYSFFRYGEVITDHLTVRRFEDNGDQLTEARPVDHWVYLRTSQDRQRFVEKITEQGFEVLDVIDEVADCPDNYTCGVHLSRVDYVDRDSVDKFAELLRDLAYEFCGTYDGWGALGIE